mmetsp:Transcript_7744/g.23433  ORF Transcript_7744/g.23433 Transcript_7744/m.23433 type:complete len:265 (+) Transcript_7744:355-1149(+)
MDSVLPASLRACFATVSSLVLLIGTHGGIPSSVSLGICLLHLGFVLFGRLLVVNNWFGVVLSDDASSLLLNLLGSSPWLVDVLGWHLVQLWDVLADEISVGVGLLSKRDGTVNAEILVEEGTGGEPHPVGVVDTPVAIQQFPFKHCRTPLPALPQVAAGQEAGHGVPCEMVDPALGFQLDHDGIDERISGAALLPRGEALLVIIPRDLLADGVAPHASKVFHGVSRAVKILPKQHLSMQGAGRFGVAALLSVDVVDFVPEETRR